MYEEIKVPVLSDSTGAFTEPELFNRLQEKINELKETVNEITVRKSPSFDKKIAERYYAYKRAFDSEPNAMIIPFEDYLYLHTTAEYNPYGSYLSYRIGNSTLRLLPGPVFYVIPNDNDIARIIFEERNK